MRKQSLVKKMIRLTLVVVILSAPLIGFGGAAIAADPVVGFNGEGAASRWGFENIPTTVKTDSNAGSTSISDIFGLKTKELAPGMERSVNIKLENKAAKSYSFFLCASELIEGNASQKESLFDLIDAVVTYNKGGSTERQLYNGKLSGKPAGGSTEELYSAGGIFLGDLGPSRSGTVTVTIKIPEKIDSDYMETQCTIDWQFIARDVIAPGPRGEEEEVESVESGAVDADEDVPEIYPPLAENENTTSIEGGEAPQGEDPNFVVAVATGSNLPQTGGIRTFILPLAVALLVLVVLLAVTFIKKRDDKGRKAAE